MRRISLFDCPIDAISISETIAEIESCINRQLHIQHVVVNVAKIVAMQDNKNLKQIVSNCHIINADGMPLYWASKLLGEPLPCRVAGVDLFFELVKLCAEKGYRPYFFGARQWVLEKMIQKFKEEYPDLDIAGFRNGYFAKAEEIKIAKEVRKSKADMLFVGFSSPMKENFLNRWISTMLVPFSMGVGGSFDIVAGKTKRAPVWMQKFGLEWAYRVYQEPRRMWKRYARTNPVFIWMVLRELVRKDIMSQK